MALTLKNRLAEYGRNTLVRNTGWMALGQGLCLFIQAAYFVIILRRLGVQQYGAFIAAVAFTHMLSPFVGLGANNLLIKHVARDRKHFPACYGNALVVTLVTGLASTAFIIGIARLVLPASIQTPVIVFVSLAELIFSKLADCASIAFQAIDRLDITARMTILSALTRLMGIAVLASVLPHPAAHHWAFVYLLTTVCGATLGLAWVQAKIGRPRFSLDRIRKEFVEGLYFSASSSAQSIYDDIDKTMLARMASLDAVGIYGAAYRLIDVAFIPVRSLLSAGYQGFFRAGRNGMQGAIDYMRRLLPKAAVFSFLVFFCLTGLAPLLPHVFGSQYTRTVEALRWLALLPFLKTIHSLLADTLTCSGHQRRRTLIQIVAAGFNVLVNLWLIPAYSWRGAAWSSLATDTLLAVLMCLAVIQVHRSTRPYGEGYRHSCAGVSPAPVLERHPTGVA